MDLPRVVALGDAIGEILGNEHMAVRQELKVLGMIEVLNLPYRPALPINGDDPVRPRHGEIGGVCSRERQTDAFFLALGRLRHEAPLAGGICRRVRRVLFLPLSKAARWIDSAWRIEAAAGRQAAARI